MATNFGGNNTQDDFCNKSNDAAVVDSDEIGSESSLRKVAPPYA